MFVTSIVNADAWRLRQVALLSRHQLAPEPFCTSSYLEKYVSQIDLKGSGLIYWIQNVCNSPECITGTTHGSFCFMPVCTHGELYVLIITHPFLFIVNLTEPNSGSIRISISVGTEFQSYIPLLMGLHFSHTEAGILSKSPSRICLGYNGCSSLCSEASRMNYNVGNWPDSITHWWPTSISPSCSQIWMVSQYHYNEFESTSFIVNPDVSEQLLMQSLRSGSRFSNIIMVLYRFNTRRSISASLFIAKVLNSWNHQQSKTKIETPHYTLHITPHISHITHCTLPQSTPYEHTR